MTPDYIGRYLTYTLQSGHSRRPYVIHAEDLPHTFTGIGGFFAQDLCWVLQSYCTPWRGPAPAFVIGTRGRDEASVMAVSIHEYAHALAARPAYHPWARSYGHRLTDYLAGADAGTDRRGGRRPPWNGHELTWVRAVCHLWHRARMQGHRGHLSESFQPSVYGLAGSPEAWFEDLGSEIKERGTFLTEILRRPPPRKLAMRWQREAIDAMRLAQWRHPA